MKSRTYLAGLSSAKQQHLYLVLCHHAIPLELALNLVVSCAQIVRVCIANEITTLETHGPWPHRRPWRTGNNPFLDVNSDTGEVGVESKRSEILKADVRKNE